jgi:hypothetical protein
MANPISWLLPLACALLPKQVFQCAKTARRTALPIDNPNFYRISIESMPHAE